MMSTGIRTPVGVRIAASDASRLDAVGEQVRMLVSRLAGTRSAVFESVGGEPWPEYEPDPAALTLFHVDRDVVQATADLVAAGGQVGELVRDGLPMRVRVTS